jgi:hypothetical protein
MMRLHIGKRCPHGFAPFREPLPAIRPGAADSVFYSCGFRPDRDNREMRHGELRPTLETAAGFFVGQIDDGQRATNTNGREQCAQR